MERNHFWLDEGQFARLSPFLPNDTRGVARVEWMFVFKAAAYNLIRLPRLLATG